MYNFKFRATELEIIISLPVDVNDGYDNPSICRPMSSPLTRTPPYIEEEDEPPLNKGDTHPSQIRVENDHIGTDRRRTRHTSLNKGRHTAHLPQRTPK